MKKAFALLLSLTLAFGCLLVGSIPAAAEGQTDPNLAKDYTHAGGQLSFNTMAEARNLDSTGNAIFGGYAWDMGVGSTGSNTEPGRAVITTGELEANTTYWFSYVYQKDFRVVLESVQDPDGAVVKQGYAANNGSVTYTDDIYDSADNKLASHGWNVRYYRVAFRFTTTAAGSYKINLKSSKAWTMPDCAWDSARFSDLRLIKQTAGNLAEEVTLGQNLTVSSNVSLAVAGEKCNGTAAYSLFGGQSWAFDLTSDDTATLTYKAYLEQNKVYTFSYVYANDYKIQMNTEHPITGPDGNTALDVEYNSQDAVKVAGNVNAYKVTVRFTALQSGEYSFYLESKKGWGNDENNWSYTSLSDLQLYEVEAFAPFAELSDENATAGLVGASMRAGAGNVKQAMRVKNSVSKAVVENGINGYTVTEYGSLVAGTEKLGSNELTMELIGSEIPAVKGAAYNKATQPTPILWAESEQYLTFTAALTGITVDNSSRELTVRPYMVLQKNENSMVLYGEAQTASVFEICKAILSSGSEADKAAVTAIMAGNAEFKAAYNAWSGNN